MIKGTLFHHKPGTFYLSYYIITHAVTLLRKAKQREKGSEGTDKHLFSSDEALAQVA